MWSDEKEEHLINMVEDRPPLFAVDDKNYSNRALKRGHWRQISEEINIPERELRKKWESLRTQYTRYKKPPPSGSSPVEKTKRQTWVLNRLQFLEPHHRRRRESKQAKKEPAAPLDPGGEDSADGQGQEEMDQTLICLVEDRPALFASDVKNYTNRQTKTDSWRQISEEMNISERELRKRWESLRTQFIRYRKLTQSGELTPRQKWILDRMRFLEPHTRRRESMNVAHKEPTAPTNTSTGASADAESGEDRAACEEEEEEASGTPSTSRGLKRRRSPQTESLSETSQDLMRLIGAALERRAAQETPMPPPPREDFIAVACKGIEHKFRMLPPHLVPRLENTVQNVIFSFFEENNLTQRPETAGLDPCLMMI